MPLSYMDDVDFYPYVYYQYDSTGNIISALHGIADNTNGTIWGATTHYEYDKNRLSKVQIDGAETRNTSNNANVTYEYYDDGKLKSVTYPALTDGTILKSEYVYDGLSRLTSLTNYKGTEVLSSYAYTYDSNGNILTTTETVGATQNNVTYTYDKLNRIASVAGTKGADSYYEYDARGNRKANFEQIDFLSEESATFVYDAEDKLVQSQVGNDTTIFEYSSNGYRYFKRKNTSYPEYYIYDTNGRLQAIAATSILSNGETTISVMFPIIHYIWGPDRVLAKIDKITNKSYYYLYNGHGDVVQIVDTSGAIKNTYDYDVWGNFLKKEETIENHFTYFGQTYDETTGLYYLRARYYDPTTGRFTQQDPAEDGYNWYIYGNQNPIVFVDISGLEYIPLRKTAEEYGFKVYYNSQTKRATLDTGVNFGPGDGKGTFIDSTGTMYIWRDGNDSSIFFLPGNDTVTDEGWMITASAVAIVTAGKSIGINKAVNVGKAVSSVSIDPNKINHIFNNSQHKLGPLLDKFGNNATKTYMAVQEAAQKVVDANNLTGTYSSTKNPIIVNVKNFTIYVGGKVENGIFNIGTFFIK